MFCSATIILGVAALLPPLVGSVSARRILMSGLWFENNRHTIAKVRENAIVLRNLNLEKNYLDYPNEYSVF